MSDRTIYRLVFSLTLALVIMLSACSGGENQQPVDSSGTPADNSDGNPTPAATPEPEDLEMEVPTPTMDKTSQYKNPVLRLDFPDPFILEDAGVYYAYATNASGRNVQLAISTDLVNWELKTDAMPVMPEWAMLQSGFVWAPEVMKVKDNYLLYYTARSKEHDKQCVGVAVADSPEGKFKDALGVPLVCQFEEGGTIDASPFRDGDKLYLLYKNDGNCCGRATYLYIQEMAPDGLSLVGEPTRLIRNDLAWEAHVIEAPTMWKHDDQYYLFYSANNYAGVEYAVGYAVCDTVTGPCTKAGDPILKSVLEQPLVIGPGHQTLLQVGDETWIFYHAWEVTPQGMRANRRLMWMDRLTWEDGVPVVQGPSTGPQPLPLVSSK